MEHRSGRKDSTLCDKLIGSGRPRVGSSRMGGAVKEGEGKELEKECQIMRHNYGAHLVF